MTERTGSDDDGSTASVNPALDDGDHPPTRQRKVDGSDEGQGEDRGAATGGPPEGIAAGDEEAGLPPADA